VTLVEDVVLLLLSDPIIVLTMQQPNIAPTRLSTRTSGEPALDRAGGGGAPPYPAPHFWQN
jgi:hypothetical protein